MCLMPPMESPRYPKTAIALQVFELSFSIMLAPCLARSHAPVNFHCLARSGKLLAPPRSLPPKLGRNKVTVMMQIIACQQRRLRHQRRAALQALCGVLLMALVSVGILGLVLGASVGRGCSWCQSVACVETRWWACQSTQEPICSYAAFGNGTAHIDCSAVRTTPTSCMSTSHRIRW